MIRLSFLSNLTQLISFVKIGVYSSYRQVIKPNEFFFNASASEWFSWSKGNLSCWKALADFINGRQGLIFLPCSLTQIPLWYQAARYQLKKPNANRVTTLTLLVFILPKSLHAKPKLDSFIYTYMLILSMSNKGLYFLLLT
jgi:hypothetical protein